VLATGSDLIDDIKKAPDDVLSNAESINEVCLLVQNGALILIEDYPARSASTHARLVERH
jgi:hypothetical protein